jgi:outer membrane protein TolC
VRKRLWSVLLTAAVSAASLASVGGPSLSAQPPTVLPASAIPVPTLPAPIDPATAAPANPEPAPAAPTPAPPGAYRLTLEDAKQRALANNKALALARLNTEEKQIATTAAKKDYLPKVLGNVTYFHFNDDLGSVVTIQRGRLGILSPGTRTINAAVLNENTALSTILVAQPITKLIAVNAAVQVARADENIAQAKADQGTRDLLSGVAQAYYGLVGALRIQAALQLQQQVLEQLLAAKPAPELRIALVEVRQGLVEIGGQIRDLTDVLNDLLDLPRCTVLTVVDPVPAAPPVHCADEAVQLALASNPKVIEAEQNVAKAEAALKIAKMEYLPDVNVVGGYANQTGASYIQDNIGYLGVTATYTFWDWRKRHDVKMQRLTDIALAHQNVEVIRDKVQLEARKAYGAYAQAEEALRLADEMTQAHKDAEAGIADPAALVAAKGATAKAELEYMKAEIAYRVAHAQLMGALGKE